jgi:NAD(P)H dehydrogenase (quinone)
MQPVKLTIIYYSASGTNYQIALAIKDAAEGAGADVRLRKARELAPDSAIDRWPAWRAHLEATRHIPEAAHEDLEWADAYIFGTPTRFGNIAAQLKQFIDTTSGLWSQGKLADKVVAAFTSASSDHGGQESTLLALHNTFYHWGSYIIPPGYTSDVVAPAGGNPYGVSAKAIDDGSIAPTIVRAAEHMAQRVVSVTQWLKVGREALELVAT